MCRHVYSALKSIRILDLIIRILDLMNYLDKTEVYQKSGWSLKLCTLSYEIVVYFIVRSTLYYITNVKS